MKREPNFIDVCVYIAAFLGITTICVGLIGPAGGTVGLFVVAPALLKLFNKQYHTKEPSSQTWEG